MTQIVFKQFCIKFRTIDIIHTSSDFSSSLISDISKSISAELVKFMKLATMLLNQREIFQFFQVNEMDASTKKPITWVSVVGESNFSKNTSMVLLLVKFTLDRKDRETNVIISISLTDINDETSKIFNQICLKTLVLWTFQLMTKVLEQKAQIIKNRLKYRFMKIGTNASFWLTLHKKLSITLKYRMICVKIKKKRLLSE